MKRILIMLFLLSVSFKTIAEVVDVKIPTGQWNISFDAPALQKKQEKHGSTSYTFKANAQRFNLSLFVEPPANAKRTHKDCYEHYWPLASKNPLIDQSTVEVSENEKYVRVQYDILADYQGQSYRLKNVNYYFVSHDQWVDVHISIIQPTTADEKVFTKFDNSLTYN